MGDILKACLSISNDPKIELLDFNEGRNRINNVGKGLEVFIEDSFAGTINEPNEQTRMIKMEQTYSYSGNQNNPPDLILHGGDAIEVKKIQSANAALALNSSYPKAKLFADSRMITKACRNCETWTEKDIIYAVGHTSDRTLKSLWMVYGDCYAAERNIYERITTTVSRGITDISDVEFFETNELGKVKKVDPLEITDLRIRGMWSIANPKAVFDYLYTPASTSLFELIVIMKKDKFLSFPEDTRNEIESSDLLQTADIKLKNPNNPVNLIDGKMLRFTLEAT